MAGVDKTDKRRGTTGYRNMLESAVQSNRGMCRHIVMLFEECARELGGDDPRCSYTRSNLAEYCPREASKSFAVFCPGQEANANTDT